MWATEQANKLWVKYLASYVLMARKGDKGGKGGDMGSKLAVQLKVNRSKSAKGWFCGTMWKGRMDLGGKL